MVTKPQARYDSDFDQKLALWPAVLALLFITAISMILLGTAYTFHKSRQNRVIARYTQETQNWARQNQVAVLSLFENTFDACAQQLEQINQEKEAKNEYRSYDFVCESAVQQLAAANVDSLKDSSAVAYVLVSDSQYQMIEASGKYHLPQDVRNGSQLRFDHWDELSRYWFQDESIVLWNDFIFYIRGKEVLVPIEIDDQVVGYVFRGVVEK